MNTHPSLKMKPERRSKLFAAATGEFTEFGFEQASLNRIIADIGMSKSSFYHYFANKTELFREIMLQTIAPFAEITERFEPELLTSETYWPTLMEMSQGSNSLVANHPEIFNVGRMFHRNLNDKNDICENLMLEPLSLVSRLLEHGKVIGTIRDDLPTSLLLDSVVALGMAVDRWAIENMEHIPLSEFSAFQQKMMNMFIRVLAPDEV